MMNDQNGPAGPGGADAEPAREGLSPATDTGRARRMGQRRRAARAAGWLAHGAVLAGVLALKFAVCSASEVDCLTAPADTRDGVLVSACRRQYEATGNPRVGLQYARARYRTGQSEAARELARSLVAAEVHGDALQLLGRIAYDEAKDDSDGRLTDAASLLGKALQIHRAERRPVAVAEDEQALANVEMEREDYVEALRALGRCITSARAGRDRRIEGYCHLSASTALLEAGMYEGARTELGRADSLLGSGRDAAQVSYAEGNLEQELGDDALAEVAFREALPVFERAQSVGMVRSIHMNLAYSVAEKDRPDEAASHLRIAAAQDQKNVRFPERLHLEGRIAYRRKNLPLAVAMLGAAYQIAENHDEQSIIASLRARISLEIDDLAGAERWAHRGIEAAEKIRIKQSALELRAWVLASRREPYELLFTALARAGRAGDALLVFNEWYGRTLLEALARLPQSPSSFDLETAALQTEELSALLPSLSSSPTLAEERDDEVLAAVRTADLLVLLVADDVVWRVVSVRQELKVEKIGRFVELRPLLDGFASRPTDRTYADALGARLLPAELVRETKEALRVVLDGPLSLLPVEALRSGGKLLIEMRPVVRPPRLSAVRCAPAPATSGRALVVADPRDDLPAARRAAGGIAESLRAELLVGRGASSAALFRAPRGDLLHISAHAVVAGSGSLLQLGDRDVPALELWHRRVTASRVVLATCGSARGGGDDGTTSLATAFLAGGAVQVVATLRPVNDAGAEEVTDHFYRANGASDPIRALAAAQRALAATPNVDWLSFAVFGQDICRTTP